MSEKKWTFKVIGLTCISCVHRTEKALKSVSGVTFATINLATETGFALSNEKVHWEDLRQAVKKAGYDISQNLDQKSEKQRWMLHRNNLFISLIFTVPLTIWMIFHMSSSHLHHESAMSYWIFELIASTVVVFYNGRHTLKGAWIGLRHYHANMDTLISLGAITSWLTAVLHFANLMEWLSIDILSFGAIGAMIMALHLTGRAIESWLRDRAAREIKALMQMKATMARWVSEKGETLLPIEAIQKDWTLKAYPGERIALDGIVLEGQSAVDESMLTGEPLPIEKKAGNELTGGSINLTGVLSYQVSKTGDETFLSQMIRLVQEAQGTKVPIQAVADKITSWFVPLVLLLAFISGLFWFFNFDRLQPFYLASRNIFPWILATSESFSFALFAFVATLVIACPCALGLATPMALINGTGLAAKKGIMIRNGESIQTSTQIRVILLDKTGTLTLGKPSVNHIDIPSEDLPIIASIESMSHHPLAKAISQTHDKKIPIDHIKEIAGKGIEAKIGQDHYFIGKANDPSLYETRFDEGQSIVECFKNQQRIGFIALEDPLREESGNIIQWVKKRGIVPIMVTGDHKLSAERIALKTGIEKVYAEVLPEEKLNIARKYQAKGYKVMMVGDGINDAAALKGADIGVAIGTGTDLAIDNADMILLREGIAGIKDLMTISGLTFHLIRQNLFGAFLYNLMAIPAAMAGWLHPVIAEAAMALSSMTVILNSLRLQKMFRRKSK